MPLQANNGSVVTATFADPQEIVISHLDDSIKIGDGTNLASVTPTGSLNVNVTEGSFDLTGSTVTSLPPIIQNVFQEVSSVAANTLTTVLSYTAPSNKFVFAVSFSGTNVATFTFRINTVIWDRIRTSYVKFNDEFNLGGGVIDLQAGDIITVEAIHTNPDVGDFEAKIQIKEQ